MVIGIPGVLLLGRNIELDQRGIGIGFKLAVSPDVPVLCCDARERKSAKSTLISLVEHTMAMQMSATQ